MITALSFCVWGISVSGFQCMFDGFQFLLDGFWFKCQRFSMESVLFIAAKFVEFSCSLLFYGISQWTNESSDTKTVIHHDMIESLMD